jgi:hypothetical protein
MATGTGYRYSKEQWQAFEKEMEDSGAGYCSNHMLNWALENFGRKPSKATLSNRFNKEVAKRTYEKTVKRRATAIGLIEKRLSFFKNRKKFLQKRLSVQECSGRNAVLERSIYNRLKKRWGNLTTEEVIQYLEKTQNFDRETSMINDYYSGERFHIMKVPFQLDHIDPTKGNEVENLALTKADYNQMKTSLQVEEWFKSMEVILRYNKPELFVDIS